MFELWIATWCAVWSYGLTPEYCVTEKQKIFSSSTTAVRYLVEESDVETFSLLKITDWDSQYLAHVYRKPKTEIKKQKKP